MTRLILNQLCKEFLLVKYARKIRTVQQMDYKYKTIKMIWKIMKTLVYTAHTKVKT